MEKVQLQITGFQWNEEREETGVETVWDAEYGERNGSHYVMYEEVTPDFPVPVKCRIKFKKDYLELVKQGPITTQMFFETGKKNEVYYGTPYGSLAMEIDTKSIEMEMRGHVICITIKYGLTTWDEPISDCRLDIKVTLPA
ncbi:MAG: DUF1934 domain-containing protein [Lachnospiraceae bacterium]|nr:DUF1934 domain-containing protein [Lachnospiraceae bacterium]